MFDVVVECAIVDVFHQKVEVLVILKTSNYLDEEGTLGQLPEDVPFSEYRLRLIVLQNLLL